MNLVLRGPFCHALKAIPVADQKDRGLWERDCPEIKILRMCKNVIVFL